MQQDEIRRLRPFKDIEHETILSIVVTSTMLLNEAQRLLKQYDITESQLNVLMMLKDKAQDGRLTQTELGKLLLIKRSGITGLIDRMEKAGLVKRTYDNSDRRVNLIEMTDRGKKVLKEVENPYFDRVSAIVDSLDTAEKESLLNNLEKVRAGIHKVKRGK